MNKMNFFLIFLLFSSLNCLDEIEYRITRGFIGRVLDRFSLKFNRLNGITAEYEAMQSGPEVPINQSKGKKKYNLTTEELGLPTLKELFKLFSKIDFPEETDWSDHRLFDVPFWHLLVDGKDYYSNVGAEFMTKFQEIVDLYTIKDYIVKKYNNDTSIQKSLNK